MPKTTPRTEILKHRNNIREILLHSNATPIRKYGGIGYTCCFCKQQYTKPADLKKHTLDIHKDVNKANFMINMNMSEYVVKLDITGLKCNICNDCFVTLEDFIRHLRFLHNKQWHDDIQPHIFPVKFDSELFHCVFCPNSFSKFRMLVRHLHKHFRNYICEICDSGFVNRNALTQHTVNHKTGEFKCNFCPKVYSTQVKKRLHERTSHTHVEANKCAYCNETFKDYRKKELHLSEEHGIEAATAVCKACDKVFSNRKMLNIHIKRDHLLERSHNCPECDKKFYSTTGLKNHMVTHSKARDYQCKLCLKFYGRKKTLNAHMRVHEEKKLQCGKCPMTFVQKWTLKSHMKTKHGEIVCQSSTV